MSRLEERPGSLAIVGCYTTADRRGRGAGIEVFAIEDGRWTHVSSTPAINPSYLAWDAARQVVFVAHGALDQVSSYRLDSAGGRLEPIGKQAIGGVNPVHLTITPDGEHLLAANYTSGDLVAVPVGGDGELHPPSARLQFAGTPGPNEAEQRGPHPHHLPLDPSGRWLIVPDKGLDTIFTVEFDGDALAIRSQTRTGPGSGPRHACFHPMLPLVYVNTELDASVGVYALDRDTGALSLLQRVGTVPPAFDGWNATSGIVPTRDGRSMFVANRGHDSVAVLPLDPATGFFTGDTVWHPSGGHFPRALTYVAGRDLLLVANQDGDRIVVYDVTDTGGLASGRSVIETPSPSSILWIER